MLGFLWLLCKSNQEGVPMSKPPVLCQHPVHMSLSPSQGPLNSGPKARMCFFPLDQRIISSNPLFDS